MQELRISVNKKKNSTTLLRRANEDDYDSVFFKDEDTGIYCGYINSNYNLSPIKPILCNSLLGFNPQKPYESLYNILSRVDEELLKRQMISRCIVLIYKSKDKIYLAKIGGGLHLLAISPPPVSGLEVSVYDLVARSWQSERDFFAGSGAALPLIECVELDTKVSIMTQSMKVALEGVYDDSIEYAFRSYFSEKLNEIEFDSFCNDVLSTVFHGSTRSDIDAYLAFI